MNTKKLFVFTCFVSVLGATLQCIDQLITANFLPAGALGFGWLSFQAWAMYFLGGGTVEGGIKTFVSYISGSVGAFLIFTVSGFLLDLGFWAAPVAILIVNPFILLLENANKWMNAVAPIFVGAGTYFGFVMYIPGATPLYAMSTILLYCFIGLTFGYITVVARARYEKL